MTDQPCKPRNLEQHLSARHVAGRDAATRRQAQARESVRRALQQSVPIPMSGLYLERATDAMLARLLLDGWRRPLTTKEKDNV